MYTDGPLRRTSVKKDTKGKTSRCPNKEVGYQSTESGVKERRKGNKYEKTDGRHEVGSGVEVYRLQVIFGWEFSGT